MVQAELFHNEVGSGKQLQRANNTARPGQSPVAEVRNRTAQVQKAHKPYRENVNRATGAATVVRLTPQEDGRARLFGWIGRYFEVKRTQSGVLRATFSVATPKTYKDQSGNAQKKTVWQKIVVWGTPAQELEQRLQTGARVHVEGKLKTREWTDDDNQLHTTTELVARNVRFLDMEENGIVA